MRRSTPSSKSINPGDSDLGVLDLGVLRARRQLHPGQFTFYAPGSLTRSVWLLGALMCGVYLYSVALSFGLVRGAPTLSETPFWLLPGLLGGLFGALALGGVRLSVKVGELELQNFWPQRSRRVLLWKDLQGVRFLKKKPGAENSFTGCGFASLQLKSPFARLTRQRGRRYANGLSEHSGLGRFKIEP